jgi:hypothetical protein
MNWDLEAVVNLNQSELETLHSALDIAADWASERGLNASRDEFVNMSDCLPRITWDERELEE